MLVYVESFVFNSEDLNLDEYMVQSNKDEGKFSIVLYSVGLLSRLNRNIGELKFKYLGSDRDESIITIDKILFNGENLEGSGFVVKSGNIKSVARAISINYSLVPDEFSLSQNYPNPFNPTTTIPFGIPEDSFVDIIVYDIKGRIVDKLVSSSAYDPGFHQVYWDASTLSSGMYFIKISAQTENPQSNNVFESVRKSILIK